MQTSRVRSLIYLAAIMAIAASAVAWAEDPSVPAPALAPDHSHMMQNHEGGATGPGMMGGDPAQMTRMMENCHRMMMESHSQTPPQPDRKS